MAKKPDLREIEEMWRAGDTGGHSYAQNMHPNPRYHKYYWWVFWRHSPVDGDAFLTAPYRLNTAAAMELIKRLREQKEPYWVYNRKLPRRDTANTPFDPDSPRWQGVEWALPYAEDPDPEWKGHK